MNPSGQPSNPEDIRRQTASSIARRKVLEAYTRAAEKSYSDPTDNASTMKQEKINPALNSESWKRYHSAWQNYYQKYYSEYYSTAAKNYIEKERLKDAREKAEDEEITRSNSHSDNNSALRSVIRRKATDSAKKTRHFKRFVPILAGLSVVLVILFLQYNRLIFAPIMAYISPGESPATSIEAIDPTVTNVVSSDPRLIIPKLNVDVPVAFGISASTAMDAMKNGVAHYRIIGASAFPGEIGNLVITGHSSGDIYSTNPYRYIFSGLERLATGDLIYINYKSTRYTYKLTRTEVVTPSNVAALTVPTTKPTLILVTCTPVGTSKNRLLVFAEQISPSYENAEISQDTEETPSASSETMPSSEPSFFEGIWNWLTGQ